MAPNAVVTCSATYTVTAADLKNNDLSNTATASGSDGNASVASADSTAVVTADPPAAPPATPPVLGYTGVDVTAGIVLGMVLFGLGGALLLIRRRRRNA